jgi:assimilatory nitrate reductase catalytic subunit
LFALDELGEDQRRMSGKSTDGLESRGPIVCACFGVGRITILAAIAAGARIAAEIGVRLKAGTNCGSCIPEMKRLIAQTDVKSAGADPEQRQFVRVAN